MYMITRLKRELKFTHLFTVRNLKQFHALCGIVKLHSNNISSNVFSSCPEIRIKLGYVYSSINPHSWLIFMSSFLLDLRTVVNFNLFKVNYFFLLAGKAYNLHWHKEIKKRLGMVSIMFGATLGRYGNNYTITSPITAVYLILRSKKYLPFSDQLSRMYVSPYFSRLFSCYSSIHCKTITFSAILSHSNFFLTVYCSSVDYSANLHSVMNTFPLFAVDFLFLLNDHPLSTQTRYNFRNKR